MAKRKIIDIKNFTRIKMVDSMNSWVGSWTFLAVHTIWFTIWLIRPWDINMLTMIVSLEAIILMILLLMSQNRQSMRDDLRDEADFQADLQTFNLSEKILGEIKSIKKDIENLKNKTR